MKAHLTRRYKFSASHRLHSPELSDQQNRETYGKCNNPYGHGHNYKVEVTVSGEPDPETGMICNLADLDGFVDRELLQQFLLERSATVRRCQLEGCFNLTTGDVDELRKVVGDVVCWDGVELDEHDYKP